MSGLAKGVRKEGKIIQRWKFRCEGYSGELEIPLRLIDDSDLKTTRISYCVDIDEPLKLKEYDKDLERLKRTVLEKVQSFFTIKWENFLHVRVDSAKTCRFSNRQHEKTRFLRLAYTRVSVGTRLDGTKCYYEVEDRQYSRARTNQGEPEVGVRDHPFERDEVQSFALVADTPENLASLDRIMAAMEDLSDRVKNLMSPDQIQKSLQMSNVLALPAPAKEKKRHVLAPGLDGAEPIQVEVSEQEYQRLLKARGGKW